MRGLGEAERWHALGDEERARKTRLPLSRSLASMDSHAIFSIARARSAAAILRGRYGHDGMAAAADARRIARMASSFSNLPLVDGSDDDELSKDGHT